MSETIPATKKKLAIIDGKSVFYPDSKILMRCNLIADYTASGFDAGHAAAGDGYA